MTNLGKAIYMATMALMFVFAASVAIYLYGTLNDYLDSATNLIGVSNRAEAASDDTGSTSKTREITVGEVLITAYNMEQMHIDTLNLNNSREINVEDSIEQNSQFNLFILELRKIPSNTKFKYTSYRGKVTYSY